MTGWTATSAMVVMAPMSNPALDSTIPAKPGTDARLTTWPGLIIPSLISSSRSEPPAITWAATSDVCKQGLCFTAKGLGLVVFGRGA